MFLSRTHNVLGGRKSLVYWFCNITYMHICIYFRLQNHFFIDRLFPQVSFIFPRSFFVGRISFHVKVSMKLSLLSFSMKNAWNFAGHYM